ncbi:receptor-like protein EIX2 isoform X1 [Gastrolobium bilobum]|uniref:receptor-like protein EIX2 isoform X1 n=1 Tax=Gastrolobium bilobum TaxID=150636 RepID=UPI002AAF9683|nr:receptor-like protein EIX2 isoform X1 [Gastrolobium bilobum]
MDRSIFTVLFLYFCCLTLLTFHFGICIDSSEILCIPSERDALLRFKHHLKDPSNRLSSWNASNPNCCHWEGVVCNNVTAHILQLHLNTSWNPPVDGFYFEKYIVADDRSLFGGEINHSLVDLKHLSYLDLSRNDFGGMQIPSFLCAITTLTYLNLSDAGFIGNIPHEIGNLSNLLYLDLSYAAAYGEIPYQIGNLTNLLYLDLRSHYSEPLFVENLDWLSGLSYLQYLDLSSLRLPGCTLNHHNQPSTVNFSSLITLDLSDTNYTDGISLVPKWIFGLRKLVSLQLRENNIQGPIPDGIQNLTLVQNLDLSYNSLSSSIPDWLYGLHHLKFLNLGSNDLSGTIFDDLGNLTSLVVLDFSVNQLEGKIPSSLGIFQNIFTMVFSSNSIHGALPASFGKLSSLRHLHLSKNKFDGNPFEVLKSLSKLSYLNIDDNLFQGVVKEDDLANLTSLKRFSASGNNFTLKVGPSWHPTFQLSALGMNSWQLGPTFPSWIQSQKDLYFLEISDTGIPNSIPTWFWETISNASYVNLSHNHIHGELANILKYPISIDTFDLSSNNLHGKLPHLYVNVSWLDLSRNSFSGSMTDFLCRKQDQPMKLQFLNLAANNLSGEIPDCWMLWPNLVDVNLQSNHFVGNLPQSMGSLAELDSLNIRNNMLSGIFPPILESTGKLISLDLGENKFTGIIPEWIGQRLLNLQILRLRSNKFLGHIPDQICDMIFLRDLDLAQNNLSGNIPKCFNRLDAMFLKNRISTLLWVKGRGIEYRNLLGMVTNVDLSDNNLSGEIPREITNLDGLIYLNLSKNHLTGQIPSSIGNMRSSESIDFSRNPLSGEIPSTISNLSFLSKLDLSYNHLMGKIPTGTQLQSFEATNFVGNNLCGPPLPVNCSSNRQTPDDDHNGKKGDGHKVNGFFVSMTFGFIVGFWAVVAPLFIYRSWRYAYFRFLDDMWYKVQSFCRL